MNGKSMGFPSVKVTGGSDEIIIRFDESTPSINGFDSLMLTREAAVDLLRQLADLLEYG